jgi:hypothetical protein
LHTGSIPVVAFGPAGRALQCRPAPADDLRMQGSKRIEQRRRVRRGERTLVVRVIEYPAASPAPVPKRPR